MYRLIFILLAIVNLSCNAQILEENNMTSTFNEVSNYLALGDSYTIGESVSEAERWPVLLVQQLNKMDYNFDNPRIIAKTGWTTGELDSAIEMENISDTFDLVTLLIGVNNQYRGGSIEEFKEEYKQLLQRSIDFAGGETDNVIVVSIPDWGVSPFALGKDRAEISEEIDDFNKVKKEETLKVGVRFVDITNISRLALDKVQYIAKDGLHFSGEMHQLWVDEIIRICF